MSDDIQKILNSVPRYEAIGNSDGSGFYINRYSSGNRETVYDDLTYEQAIALVDILNNFSIHEYR